MFLNRTFGDFLHKGKNVSCFLPRGKAQGAPSPVLPRVRSRKPTASPLVALDLEHPGLLQRQGKTGLIIFLNRPCGQQAKVNKGGPLKSSGRRIC